MSRIIGLLFAALLLSACSRLTEANYARLEAGMSYAEVEAILGAAERCDETIGLKQCVWGDAARSISANFVADKAVLFSSRNIR